MFLLDLIHVIATFVYFYEFRASCLYINSNITQNE